MKKTLIELGYLFFKIFFFLSAPFLLIVVRVADIIHVLGRRRKDKRFKHLYPEAEIDG